MTFSRKDARSPYMEWAKVNSTAKYNLATSGVAAYPLSSLHISSSQLEINGDSQYGFKPLVDAIAARYGVPSDCVLTAAGTSMANYLALAAATEPGDEVLIEQPTYELLLSTAQYLQLEIRRFQRPASRSFRPDAAEIERTFSPRTKLIVLTNLHNPSGVLINEDRIQAIGHIAKQHDARVLVDEVYLEMLFEPRPSTAFRLDPDCFIVTNSLTKAYGLSGLRCGWVLAAPELVQRMWRINDLHASTPVFPGEQISVIAFQKLEQVSARSKSLLKVNRELLRSFLESRDLEYFWPEQGTIVFPRLKRGKVEDLCAFLREKFETTVVPGSFFESPDHFRIGVGGETASVQESLQQLGRGLDEFTSRQVAR